MNMMPNSYAGSHACCPYWSASGENRIDCESMITGATCRHVFDSREDREIYERSMCCSMEYDLCEYCATMEKKYFEKMHEKSRE